MASLDDVTGLRARFLCAMAVVHPASAMDLVERLVLEASEAQLEAAAEQHDLTSALDELLWSPVTFERGLGCLYRLARAIPESNRYGPRHLFRRIYQLVLGGTYVPYQKRLEVARSLLAQADDPGRDLIGRAIGNALDLNYSRTISERGRLVGREDWLPQTAAEARSVREEAWRLLIQIADEHPSSRSMVGRVLAESLRSALDSGLGALVEETLPAIDWDAAARGRLLHEYRLLLDYDKNLTADERASAERVENALQGADFSARLAVVLAAEPHQILRLGDDGSPQAPDAMDLVVQEMLGDETNIRLALDQAGAGNPLMVETMFGRFGRLQPKPGTYETVSSHQPRSLPAMIGFLAGCDAAGQTAWVDDRVAEWVELPDLRTHVPASSPSTDSFRRAGWQSTGFGRDGAGIFTRTWLPAVRCASFKAGSSDDRSPGLWLWQGEPGDSRERAGHHAAVGRGRRKSARWRRRRERLRTRRSNPGR